MDTLVYLSGGLQVHPFAKARLIILSIVLVFAACSDDDPTGPGTTPRVQVPHISYYDIDNGDLKYAVKSGGVWTPETADATGRVGGYTSLVLR